MMRPWALWQRNLVGAVVVACAVGGFVALDFGPQWSVYRHSVTPELVVPDGQSGSADGQTWELESVRHLNRSPLNFGPPLPKGTVLTVFVVKWTGTPIAGMCNGVLTDGQRRWEAESIGGFTPIPTGDIQSLCDKPGRIQFAFVTPNDVVPTALDVTHNAQITVRMLL